MEVLFWRQIYEIFDISFKKICVSSVQFFKDPNLDEKNVNGDFRKSLFLIK